MSLIRICNINILLISLVILIIELIYGGWIFPEQKNWCSYLSCSLDVEYESKIAGKTTRFTKDKFGLRNRNKVNSDIDILVMGGSTSDQRYSDNNETWDHLLQEMFKKDGINIDIVNAGIDGQSTIGHIWSFKEWFPDIPNFLPKYILFYVGLNDIPPQHNVGAGFDYPSESGWKHKIRKNSVLYRIYYKFKYSDSLDKHNAAARKAKVGHNVIDTNLNYTDKFNYQKNNWELYRKLVVEDKLNANLDSLVNLTRQLGAEPIFVTQKSARFILKDKYIYGAGTDDSIYNFNGNLFKMSNSDFGYAEKIVSNSIMEFCNSNNLHCINGFDKFDINRHNTYDFVHTNVQGSLEIAKKLYSELKTLYFDKD